MKKVISPITSTAIKINKINAGAALAQKYQIRNLNVHEYCAFDIMAKYGVPLPKGVVADTPDAAEKAFKSSTFGGKEIVIKAQALTGGRGRGHFENGFQGGVQVVKSASEAKDVASKMLGHTLITKQTGAEGKPVNKVFLMEKMDLKRETYFSILMDRGHAGPILVGSPSGGMAIEDVAAATPEKIFTERIDIKKGLDKETASRLAKNMGFVGDSNAKCSDTITKLYDLFIKSDATLVEINPLAETADGGVYACDCKLNFDDNAEFRQKEIHKLRDRTQEDPREVEAAQYDLNYIGLDGSIGCLVNGAGLAMATMDIIKLNGGSPANFLDVGGGANEKQVQKAFEILNADKKVKAILVNIFGGIMRCDVIAQGVTAAAKNIGLEKPVVIRLQGTNVDLAKKVIKESNVKMTMTDDLDEAAATAVKIANA